MNLCFLKGKIVSDIYFKFIINSNNCSISYFYIELKNNSVIKIIGYNEIADYCYSKLSKNDYIFIEGILNDDYEVILNNIIKC